VVFGHVIAVEAGAVVGLDQRQPIGVERAERFAGVPVHVVEHAEAHHALLPVINSDRMLLRGRS